MKKKTTLLKSALVFTLTYFISLSGSARNTQGQLLADGATVVTSQMLAKDNLDKAIYETNSTLQKANTLNSQLDTNSLFRPLMSKHINTLKTLVSTLQNMQKQKQSLSWEKYHEITGQLSTVLFDIEEINIAVTIELQNKGDKYGYLDKAIYETNSTLQKANTLNSQLDTNSLFSPLMSKHINTLKTLVSTLQNMQKQKQSLSWEKYHEITGQLRTVLFDIEEINIAVTIELQNKGEK